MSTEAAKDMVNYYEILDVSPKASASEAYSAYQRIKLAYSPRNAELFKTFTIEELQHLLILVEEAYATISNKAMRDLYDAQLFAQLPELATQITNVDFEPDEEVAPAEETLSPGHQKTALSIYVVDDSFEALIDSQDFYDGIFLSKVRQYKQVSLEDFGRYTCINFKYLQAIEENNYDALPARVFTLGYVKQYCRVLGLDEERITSSFMTLFENARG